MKSGTILSQEDQFNNSNAKKKTFLRTQKSMFAKFFTFSKKFSIFGIYLYPKLF